MSRDSPLPTHHPAVAGRKCSPAWLVFPPTILHPYLYLFLLNQTFHIPQSHLIPHLCGPQRGSMEENDT